MTHVVPQHVVMTLVVMTLGVPVPAAGQCLVGLMG